MHSDLIFLKWFLNIKLETEMKLLVPKARAALERYGHQIVVGNELHRRKYEVVFIARKQENGEINSSSSLATNDFDEIWLRIDEKASNGGKEIEEDIVDELVRRHRVWCENSKTA
jgi:phosphopantothenate---cysteine ligase (ATP)